MAIKKTSKKQEVKKRKWFKVPSPPEGSIPMTDEEVEKKWEEVHLQAKQELFCQLYTSKEFFGNWVQSYIEAYDPDTSKPNWYKTACASASQILSNIKVCNRINEMLESEGLNDQFIDKQLLFLATQHDDKGAKIAAIREYNKLKQRITDKLDVTTKGDAIWTWSEIVAHRK